VEQAPLFMISERINIRDADLRDDREHTIVVDVQTPSLEEQLASVGLSLDPHPTPSPIEPTPTRQEVVKVPEWSGTKNVLDVRNSLIYEPGIHRTDLFNNVRIVGTVQRVYQGGVLENDEQFWYADLQIDNEQIITLVIGPDNWRISVAELSGGPDQQTVMGYDGSVATYMSSYVRDYLMQNLGMPIVIDFHDNTVDQVLGNKGTPECDLICEQYIAVFEESDTPLIITESLRMMPGSRSTNDYNGSVLTSGKVWIPNFSTSGAPRYSFNS
jgi:hypothetical protein